MTDRSRFAFQRTVYNFDHLVDGKSVALSISGAQVLARSHRWDPLADVHNLDVGQLALLSHNSQVILMHLQDHARVLATVVRDHIVGSVLVPTTLLHQAGSSQGLIRVRLQLKLVAQDVNLLLALVQDDRDFSAFNIDDLSCLTLVLAFCDAHKVARLKVFA